MSEIEGEDENELLDLFIVRLIESRRFQEVRGVRKGEGMSERVVVPEGMLDAAESASEEYLRSNHSRRGHAHAVLEAALLLLSEHPIVPTEEQTDVAAIEFDKSKTAFGSFAHWWAAEWQRIMFRAPEPAVKMLCPTCNRELRYGNEFQTTSTTPESERAIINAWLRKHRRDGEVSFLDDAMAQDLLESLEAYRRGRRGK